MSALSQSDKKIAEVVAAAGSVAAPAAANLPMARAISLSAATTAAPAAARAKSHPARAGIEARLASRRNQLDLLRLLAPLLVIFSHYYALRDGDNSAEPYQRVSGYCNFGKVGVYTLFFISGLLAARSFIGRPNPIAYLWGRVRRVFPALWVCVALSVLVAGPLLTNLSLRDYFASHETWQFAGNAVLLPNHYDLPGVFARYTHGDPRAAMNGSLWSVPCGMLMFLAVAVLGTPRLLGRKTVVGLLTAALFVAWLAYQYGYVAATPGTLLYRHRIWVEFLPHLGFFFFAGVLVYLCRDQLVPDARVMLAALAAIVATWQVAWPGNRVGYAVFTLCWPLVIASLAFARVPVAGRGLRSVNRFGDLSYGAYLYGYPVQQLLMARAPGLSAGMHTLAACAGALLLAAGSWWVIERRHRL
jgi:peptidoglycan/LPS O-acetylase OafA/YrhL